MTVHVFRMDTKLTVEDVLAYHHEVPDAPNASIFPMHWTPYETLCSARFWGSSQDNVRAPHTMIR